MKLVLDFKIFSRGYWMVLLSGALGITTVLLLRPMLSGPLAMIALGVIFVIVYLGVILAFGLDPADKEVVVMTARKVF